MQTVRRLIVPAVDAVLLGACANVDVDRTVASFDEATYADDLSECRGGSAVAFVAEAVGTTLVGSAYGFINGIYYGALAGDTAEGALIGTIVGGAVGLGAGGHHAAVAHDEELVKCLRAKGYAPDPL
ncbi:MAG: hypothetical protein VCD33_16690 [Alphaproteobacteria bacterium]